MNTIKIDHDGTRIALSFRREVGDIRKVRWLSAHEAVSLGLLMTADAPEEAIIKFDVTDELSVQVINAPYENVYLSVRDLRGTRTLVVSIEGKTVKHIGQRLLRLGRIINGSKRKKIDPLVCPVSYCYFEETEAG